MNLPTNRVYYRRLLDNFVSCSIFFLLYMPDFFSGIKKVNHNLFPYESSISSLCCMLVNLNSHP